MDNPQEQIKEKLKHIVDLAEALVKIIRGSDPVCPVCNEPNYNHTSTCEIPKILTDIEKIKRISL